MTDSTRNIASSQPSVIDPNFFLPPGVVDLRYVNDQDTDGLYSDDDPEEVTDPDTGEPTDGDINVGDVTTALAPPANITIVSQSVRPLSGGSYVVDVVIEVEDVPGVTNYETRLSK